jgi:uncharacterized protein
MRINILGFVTVGVLSWSTAAWADASADCKRLYDAKDWEKAFVACAASAEQGDAVAQFNVGSMYLFGIGVVQNYTEAARWNKMAAEQGNSSAATDLGTMYRYGDGVEQDYVEAVRWYKLAAEQGNTFAQGLLGNMYARGNGVIKDYVKAYMWFTLAAAKGSEQSIKNMDFIINEMTPAQIAEAQQRAQVCLESNYKNC